MKLIKAIIFVIVVVVALNYLGLLEPDFGKKVDKAVEGAIEKVNNIEYKGKKLTEMSIKEIADNVTSDINYLKEEVVTEDGIKLGNKGLKVELTPNKDRVLLATVDTTNSEAVKALEELVTNLTGKEYKIPAEKLGLDELKLVVEKVDGSYQVKLDK